MRQNLRDGFERGVLWPVWLGVFLLLGQLCLLRYAEAARLESFIAMGVTGAVAVWLSGESLDRARRARAAEATERTAIVAPGDR